MRQLTHHQFQDSYNKEFDRTRRAIEENGWEETRNAHLQEFPRSTRRSEMTFAEYYKGCAQCDALYEYQ